MTGTLIDGSILCHWMKVNMLLPRTMDSRPSYKQLILLDLKIIQQITYLILLSKKKKKKPKCIVSTTRIRLTEQTTRSILESVCVDYIIRPTEIQKKQLKSSMACNVNGKSTVVSMGSQSSVQTTDKLLKSKQQSN